MLITFGGNSCSDGCTCRFGTGGFFLLGTGFAIVQTFLVLLKILLLGVLGVRIGGVLLLG